MNKINLDKSAEHIVPSRRELQSTAALDNRIDPAEVSRLQIAYLGRRCRVSASRARLLAPFAFSGGAA